VSNTRLLIVGNDGGTNIGGSLLRAAQQLRLQAALVPSQEAMEAPAILRRFNWWVRGRRPTWLGRFNKRLLRTLDAARPEWLVATGPAPISREALQKMGEMGVRTINYLTDDPFNPVHRAPWFLRALPFYDQVFSPRRSNLCDLETLGCRAVAYLPFGYDPELQYPESVRDEREIARVGADIIFAGGADRDRVPYVAALIDAGFRTALYGDYWERFPETRANTRGHADPVTLRRATACAKVGLALVRRANRDGHVMRSFEIAAVGTCLLAEDTEEHREIFGPDGEAVAYFNTMGEMVERARFLLEHDGEREKLAEAAHRRIVGGANTYRDRLASMVALDRAGGARLSRAAT
jgi:spore maturation protein CgeB